ncbi:amidohydrolase family protein, partial [Candidatus Aerophobetes bacterium]|nr:amidohydrolase family protein [Candidatus Aerophobetes bacterium]
EDALKMASHNPLKFLTRNDEAGTIDIGTQANLFCFQWDTDRKQMKILETIVEGNKVSQSL